MRSSCEAALGSIDDGCWSEFSRYSEDEACCSVVGADDVILFVCYWIKLVWNWITTPNESFTMNQSPFRSKGVDLGIGNSSFGWMESSLAWSGCGSGLLSFQIDVPDRMGGSFSRSNRCRWWSLLGSSWKLDLKLTEVWGKLLCGFLFLRYMEAIMQLSIGYIIRAFGAFSLLLFGVCIIAYTFFKKLVMIHGSDGAWWGYLYGCSSFISDGFWLLCFGSLFDCRHRVQSSCTVRVWMILHPCL